MSAESILRADGRGENDGTVDDVINGLDDVITWVDDGITWLDDVITWVDDGITWVDGDSMCVRVDELASGWDCQNSVCKRAASAGRGECTSKRTGWWCIQDGVASRFNQ